MNAFHFAQIVYIMTVYAVVPPKPHEIDSLLVQIARNDNLCVFRMKHRPKIANPNSCVVLVFKCAHIAIKTAQRVIKAPNKIIAATAQQSLTVTAPIDARLDVAKLPRMNTLRATAPANHSKIKQLQRFLLIFSDCKETFVEWMNSN